MPKAANRRTLALSAISFLLIGGLVFGGWFILSKDTGTSVSSQPLVMRTFAWERDKLEYPENGVPESKREAGNFDGSEWSIGLEIKEKTLSPVIGAKITGELRLLKDGKPADELPSGLAGINMAWDGIMTYRCASPLVSLPNFTDIPRNCGGLYEVPLDTEARYGTFRGAPDNTALSSFVVSPSAKHTVADEKTGVWGDNFVQVSKEPAKFTLVYMGGRYLPYVNVRAYLGDDVRNPVAITNKVVMFTDQVEKDWDMDVAEVVKGEFYYEATTSIEERIVDNGAGSVRGGVPRVIKVLRVDVVAKDTQTGRIHDEEYQRIRAWAFPLIVNDGYPRPEEYAGMFVDASYVTGDKYEPPNTINGVTPPGAIFDVFGSSGGATGTAVEIDLVEGKGTVYYATPSLNLSQPYSSKLAILIQPTDYAMVQCSNVACFWSLRGYENMPELPEDFAGFGKQLLYGFWRKDMSLINQIHTIVTHPLVDLAS